MRFGVFTLHSLICNLSPLGLERCWRKDLVSAAVAVFHHAANNDTAWEIPSGTGKKVITAHNILSLPLFRGLNHSKCQRLRRL
jgi:hypothetical protein